VASGFNRWAAAKFITVNELSPSTAGKKAGIVLFDALKSFLTRPPNTITINPKYGLQYRAQNTGAYVLYSNHPNPIVLDKGERRLVVIDRLKAHNAIKADPAKNWNYMNRNLLENPTALEAVARFLITRFKTMSTQRLDALFTDAPMTAAKETIIEGDIPTEEGFVEELIETSRDKGRQFWTLDDLRQLYDAEISRRGNDLKYSNFKQFTRALRQAGAWKPHQSTGTAGDREGRVILSSGRQVVYALYETKGLPVNTFMTATEIAEAFKTQSAATGSNVVKFPEHETLDATVATEKKK
jgi:hypothetical protein